MVLTGVAVLAVASVAAAGPFTPNMNLDPYDPTPDGTPTPNTNNDGVPSLFEAANAIAGTSYVGNWDLDAFVVAGDHPWQLLGSQGQVALIGLTASYLNTLGYYTDLATGAGKTGLLTATGFGFVNPYKGAVFSPGGQFGWYLHANQTTYYYSDPTLNPSGLDHMLTYKVPGLAGKTISVDFGSGASSFTLSPNAVLIGFEDLPLSGGVLGDEDYDDMIYVLDSVQPVPDGGATLALLGLGLAGIEVLRRRVRR